MNEDEDTYMEVVEKYTLYGANTFTLMKHKTFFDCKLLLF